MCKLIVKDFFSIYANIQPSIDEYMFTLFQVKLKTNGIKMFILNKA